MSRYAIGSLVSAFGLKGYLKFLPASHDADRFTGLKRVFIGRDEKTATATTVEDVISNQKGLFVKLSAVHDRTEAEQCVGQFLFVDEKNVRRPKKGEYFIHDIIGCIVKTTDGKVVGVVEDVVRSQAQDLWAIRVNKEIVYIPAVKEFIKKVDIAGKIIVVSIIEGLIEEQQ